MYRITANAAATHVASGAAASGPSRSTTIFEPADDARRAAARGEAESAEALERIAPRARRAAAQAASVVVLKDVYGLSHEAIAEELGISVAAAKVRLHRARRKLRDVLYDEGAEAHAV